MASTKVELPERKYRMMRLGPGDYLCPSNDRTKLWRFTMHRDGTAYGLVNVSYRDREFWRAVWMPMEQAEQFFAERGGDLPDPWTSVWTEADWYLPSRKAAIEVMLRAEVVG